MEEHMMMEDGVILVEEHGIDYFMIVLLIFT